MSARFNEDDDVIALKRHGYVFSDGDDTTDTESERECSGVELYERYKPPPLEIPPEKIVIIKASNANRTDEKNYVLENDDAFKKKKKKKKRLSQKKYERIAADNFINVSNFYTVLQLNDSVSEPENENAEETDPPAPTFALGVKLLTENGRIGENTHSEIPKIKDRKRTKKKVENKEQLNGLTVSVELEQFSDTSVGNGVNFHERDLRRKAVTKTEASQFKRKMQMTRRRYKHKQLFDADVDVFPIYSLYYLGSAAKPIISEVRTSWDYISKDSIYRSDKLIEQEYDNIAGSKEISPSPASTPYLSPIVKPLPTAPITNFLKEIDYIECLCMASFLVAAYFSRKINLRHK